MSISEQLREEARETTILQAILTLMKNTGWGIGKTLCAIGLSEDEKDLYRRSALYALEHERVVTKTSDT